MIFNDVYNLVHEWWYHCRVLSQLRRGVGEVGITVARGVSDQHPQLREN